MGAEPHVGIMLVFSYGMTGLTAAAVYLALLWLQSCAVGCAAVGCCPRGCLFWLVESLPQLWLWAHATTWSNMSHLTSAGYDLGCLCLPDRAMCMCCSTRA